MFASEQHELVGWWEVVVNTVFEPQQTIVSILTAYESIVVPSKIHGDSGRSGNNLYGGSLRVIR